MKNIKIVTKTGEEESEKIIFIPESEEDCKTISSIKNDEFFSAECDKCFFCHNLICWGTSIDGKTKIIKVEIIDLIDSSKEKKYD